MSDPPPSAGLHDLDGPTWQRLSVVLDQALELPAEDLPAFLDRACRGDPALRARAESLLAADRDAGGVLDRPLDPAALALLEEATSEARATEPSGRRIGPWRLVREIGHGGMGTVYLAERADAGFEQRAAIKLVRRILVSDDLRVRFLQERRILARLEHPNISRLLDGGVTDDGAPYLAMELVEGQPITTWCEQTGARLPAVLLLFAQCCRAVEHAHRNLVVHRDLKPANILVTAAGEVKLLDFGIAKLLEPGADDEDPGTLTVERRLTPHYAAPEQIRGEASTTATDVYALGVVLYELLTGLRPFHAQAATPTGLERAVLEQDPPSPSTALASNAAGPRQRAWRARVPGDLDRIVLQAMRKDRAARYPTVNALREDVERWVEGLPVRATTPTLGYRLRKFVGRNRAVSLAAAGLLLSLVVGLVGVSWQAARARQEKQKAEVIRDFALGLFRASDPSESKGDTLSARDLVERGVARVEHELQGQPGLQAEMFSVLGGVFRELETYDRAQDMYRHAVALLRHAFGDRSPKVAPGLVKLAATLSDQARFAEAERPLNEALTLLGRSRRDPERANALAGLAVVRGKTGAFAAAESLYRESLAIDEAAFGTRSVPVAQVLDDLGNLYFDRRLYDQAATCFERALDIRMGLQGRDHVATAASMENVASISGHLGHHAREDSLHLEALAIYRRLLGPESVAAGNVLSNLGAVYYSHGDTVAAESAMSEAVRIFRRRLGDDHPETARALNNLAYLHASYYRFAEAESLYRLAVGSWRRTLGERHPLTLHGKTNLANVLRDQGRFAESERLYRSVLEGDPPHGDPEDVEIGLTCHHLGVLYLRTGRYAEAERMLRRALAIRRKTTGGYNGWVSQTLSALGELLLYRDRIEDSRDAFAEAFALDSARGEVDRWRGASLGLGRALTGTREFARAESLLLDAVAAREKLLGPSDPRTTEARTALGLCYAAQGRRDLAEPILRSALPVLERSPLFSAGLVRQSRASLDRLRSGAAAR